MSHNAHVLCFSRGSAHRIKTVAPRTDNEMDTEAAAYARTELALQSKERRKQEAAELVKWNAHMKQKVAAAQDADGWDEEADALCNIIAARELQPPSDVSTQKYIMYKNYLEKNEMGNETREQRKANEQRRKELKEAFMHRGQERIERRASQTRAMKKNLANRERSIAERGRALKAQEAEWEERKNKDKRRHEAKMKKLVTEARGLDSRLDASEEAQDAAERHEANMMRLQISEALKMSRDERTSARRLMATSVRESSRQAVQEAGARTQREAMTRAKEHREEQAMRRFLKEQSEAEYLAEARANRDKAFASRATAKSSVSSMQRQKNADADRIRSWADTEWNFEDTAVNIINRKRQVAEQYSTRYVSSDMASEWMGSPLQKLHAAARHAMETATKVMGGSPPKSASGRSPFHASPGGESTVSI